MNYHKASSGLDSTEVTLWITAPKGVGSTPLLKFYVRSTLLHLPHLTPPPQNTLSGYIGVTCVKVHLQRIDVGCRRVCGPITHSAETRMINRNRMKRNRTHRDYYWICGSKYLWCVPFCCCHCADLIAVFCNTKKLSRCYGSHIGNAMVILG